MAGFMTVLIFGLAILTIILFIQWIRVPFMIENIRDSLKNIEEQSKGE